MAFGVGKNFAMDIFRGGSYFFGNALSAILNGSLSSKALNFVSRGSRFYSRASGFSSYVVPKSFKKNLNSNSNSRVV